MVHSRTRQELLDEVVRALVESGGFALAFAAWYDPETHELKPVARFGETGYIDRIRIFGDERPEGQGPAGRAFRSGICCLMQDFLADPRTVPWRQAARAFGLHAAAGIPISMGRAPRASGRRRLSAKAKSGYGKACAFPESASSITTTLRTRSTGRPSSVLSTA
jgi:hypothetical protein